MINLVPPADDFLVQLFLLLLAAIAAGEVASRVGLVPLVGQLLVGIVLGPTLLGPYIGLSTSTLPAELTGIQFLATFFILFMAGLHVNPDEFTRMKASTAVLGVTIFAIPFGVGAGVIAWLEPGLATTTDLFVALTLSITALPVMGIMVSEFGLTGRRLGNLVMSAALVNELTAVTVFAILLQLRNANHSDLAAIVIALVELGLFLGVILATSRIVTLIRASGWWRRTPNRMGNLWRSREAGFAILMAMALGAALYSQVLGLTYLVGAFYAGLLVAQAMGGPARESRTFVSTFDPTGRLISQPVPETGPYASFVSIFTTMTWMFFIPIFFALVGVEMDLAELGGVAVLGVVGVLLVMALVSKLGTGAIFLRGVLKFSGPDSVAGGFLLTSRGAVELAIAVLLLADKVLSVRLFTIVVLVGLLTTLVSPLGALWAWRSTPESRAELAERMPAARQGRAFRLAPAIDNPPPPQTGRPPSPPPAP